MPKIGGTAVGIVEDIDRHPDIAIVAIGRGGQIEGELVKDVAGLSSGREFARGACPKAGYFTHNRDDESDDDSGDHGRDHELHEREAPGANRCCRARHHWITSYPRRRHRLRQTRLAGCGG